MRARKPTPRPPQIIALDMDDGRTINVTVRRPRRARRMSLRLDATGTGVVLVLPRGVGVDEGARFAREMRRWLAERLSTLPKHRPFVPGAVLPLLGTPLTIRHHPGTRRATRRDGTDLLVGGAPEHVARRVRDWLKAEAKTELTRRSLALAARLEQRITRVRIGDPKSRWGSCSSRGALAYSWRLVLAPSHVLEYVVAHEVAHLVELNHSPRFWRLVASLCADVAGAKLWLKRNGRELMRFG